MLGVAFVAGGVDVVVNVVVIFGCGLFVGEIVVALIGVVICLMLCCYSGRCVWFRVCGMGGAMLTHLDAMLAQRGAMFSHLCGHVGPSWKLCWPILGLCWPSLELYWPNLGAMLLHIEGIIVHLETCVGPC